MNAIQKEAFHLAGGSTMVNAQTLAKLSIHLAKSSAEWLSKTVIGNLTKPDIEKCATVCIEGFSCITTRAGLYATVRACVRGREDFNYVTTRGGKFAECIKKGGTANATLHQNVKSHFGYQPFGSMPRDCSSLRITRLIQADTDASPSCERACLIPASNSGSTRNAICLLPLPLMLMVDIWLTPDYFEVVTKCMTSAYQKTMPRSGGTLAGHLTTTDSIIIEEAVMKHTTHPKGRHLLTQNSGDAPQSFVWIIAAVRRDCPIIRPMLHHIAATTEQEARRTLAKEHVCFFAGRLTVPSNGLMQSLTP